MKSTPTQPQPPEEVKRKDWTHTIHDEEIFLHYKGADAGVLLPNPAFTPWHVNALIATLNAYFPTEPGTRNECPTPYLTPRPPAGITTERDLCSNAYVQPPTPVAEWAKLIGEVVEDLRQNIEMMRANIRPLKPATDNQRIELAIARVERQIAALESSRHAPADSASAQLAAMREERDRALSQAKASESALTAVSWPLVQWDKSGDAPDEIAQRLVESLAAAQSEVGRLTKERDEVMTELSRTLKWARDLQALFRSENTHAIKLAEAGGVLSGELATLRRERDELRAELLTTHQMACRVGLERDELRAKQGEAP